MGEDAERAKDGREEENAEGERKNKSLAGHKAQEATVTFGAGKEGLRWVHGLGVALAVPFPGGAGDFREVLRKRGGKFRKKTSWGVRGVEMT